MKQEKLNRGLNKRFFFEGVYHMLVFAVFNLMGW